MTIPYSRPRVPAPPSIGRFLLTLGYAWLMIGFFTGTLVLVLFVRGIVDVLQRMGWGQGAQNRVLIGVILLFVVVSFVLARAVVRAVYRREPRTRQLALVGLALPALVSAYAWSNPTRYLAGLAGTTTSSVALANGPTFLFGSYPDSGALAKLKKEGVTSIVSLQSPKVLVEISGISAERETAAAMGLSFIEAPMLPWVSDNEASLAKIRELALHGHGTYYVHCGLGRDRVNIAKRVIESLGPQTHATVAGTVDLKSATGFDRRTEPFERGMPMKLADGAWVVPFLNPDEFYGFVLEGKPGLVILALNPADTLQRRWIADAGRMMTQYAVQYTLVPYPKANGDTSTAAIVALVQQQKPPFTVIVPTMTMGLGDPVNPVARAVARLYNASVKPLPKTVKLDKGETPDLVAPPGGVPSKP